MKPVGAQHHNSRWIRMGQDRTQLLRSLAIDRGEAQPSSPALRRPKPFVLAVVAAAVLVAGAWLLSTQLRAPAPAALVVSEQPARPPNPAPPVTVAEPRQGGGLTASGYVVARRKATVA